MTRTIKLYALPDAGLLLLILRDDAHLLAPLRGSLRPAPCLSHGVRVNALGRQRGLLGPGPLELLRML